MINHAQPTVSSAAALAHAPASRPLELLEARRLRDSLKTLLRTEQAAMADFLVALADFDHRRGWEPLGHANLFAFLHVELQLSKSAAFYRKSAAELLQDFPEVIEPLRDGRLCLSTVAELAKVLTRENLTVVAPRFFGRSAREAQELVAELQPRPVPSTRMVVTRVQDQSVASPATITQPLLTLASPTAFAPESAPLTGTHPAEVPLSRVLTSDFANGGGAIGGAGTLLTKRDEVVPLTAEVRRVHFNVGTRVVQKLEAARDGLSHAIRGATMEQVLEAALDLLLEKQARARGQVKRPRTTLAVEAPQAEAPRAVATQADAPCVAAPRADAPCVAAPRADAPRVAAPRADAPCVAAPRADAPRVAAPRAEEPPVVAPQAEAVSIISKSQGGLARPLQETSPHFAVLPTEPRPTGPPTTEPRPPRRTGPRETIPAAVRRAVWERDGGRCCWPIDGGGVCGSTHQLELDHVVPWARSGGKMEDNLRLTCHHHNALAARQAFGARWMGRYQRAGRAT